MNYSDKINNFYNSRINRQKNGSYKIKSVSGIGSDLFYITDTINNINSIIKKYKIKKILDAPCGDFEWMKLIDLSEIDYTGYDIVDRIINNNNSNYKKNNIRFEVKNLFDIDIKEKYDLIICRDLFFHLTDDLIKLLLNKFKKSESTFLLATNNDCDYTEVSKKFNIGLSFRPINLLKEPFNLKGVELCFEEKNFNRYMCLFNLKV